MTTLYEISLYLHSWNRWIILISGLLIIVFAIRGLRSGSVYSRGQTKLQLIFLSSLHLQLLVGLLLYFVLSPITQLALQDFGAAMKDSAIRYWAVEHSFINIIAIALAQTGSILAKRRTTDRAKFRTILIWTSIALFLILLMIPMGMMGVDRPWFRF